MASSETVMPVSLIQQPTRLLARRMAREQKVRVRRSVSSLIWARVSTRWNTLAASSLFVITFGAKMSKYRAKIIGDTTMQAVAGSKIKEMKRTACLADAGDNSWFTPGPGG